MDSVLIHGMIVLTPVPLAAGAAGAGAESSPDLVLDVRRGPLVESGVGRADLLVEVDDPHRRQHYRLARTTSGWVLTFPGTMIVTFSAEHPRVEVCVRPDVPTGLVSVLLGGPALSILAMARGATLLHASAVTWPAPGPTPGPTPDQVPVIAFVGSPGSGKSTLARMLAQGRRQVFSDDALSIQLGAEGPPVVHRGTVESRLRGTRHIGPDGHDPAVRRSADGRVLVRSDAEAPPRGRLVAVVLPRLATDVEASGLREVPTLEAMMALATSWPVSGVVDPGLAQRQFDLAGRLLASVPVRTLDVPWPPPADPAPLAAAVAETLSAGLPDLMDPVAGGAG